MGTAIATIQQIRGETISFGIRSEPPYDGTEYVTCDIKVALGGKRVPPITTPPVLSVVPTFHAAAGDEAAHWMFTISDQETADLTPQIYITDARVEYTDGTVDYPRPLAIELAERVTE